MVDLMPAGFLGHGSPMNALEHNRFTEAWQAFGLATPRPRAILCVSAHWYINASAVTAMAQPKTIHDFYGFPDELFAVQYPAPGDPALAEEVVEVVRPTWVGLDLDSWGIDHGTWSVLVHAFPAADVPVLQLAINAQLSFEDHVALGAALAPLRERGVLILGSGNVVHNLGQIDWSLGDEGFAWARRFDDSARDVLQTDPASMPRLVKHRDFRPAVPTPDHFIPILYLAGLAAASGERPEVLVSGCSLGSLSMTSYGLGVRSDVGSTAGSARGAALLPADIPPEDTNA